MDAYRNINCRFMSLACYAGLSSTLKAEAGEALLGDTDLLT